MESYICLVEAKTKKEEKFDTASKKFNVQLSQRAMFIYNLEVNITEILKSNIEDK